VITDGFSEVFLCSDDDHDLSKAIVQPVAMMMISHARFAGFSLGYPQILSPYQDFLNVKMILAAEEKK
ncbi:hypothetical protein AVEN_118254-2-1, partial [Araneus ventricosus]